VLIVSFYRIPAVDPVLRNRVEPDVTIDFLAFLYFDYFVFLNSASRFYLGRVHVAEREMPRTGC
jgi:hypothetical protein